MSQGCKVERKYYDDGNILVEIWYKDGKKLSKEKVTHAKNMKKTMKQLSHASKMHSARPILRRRIPEEMVREIGEFV